MTRTIAEINEKIRKGQAVVATAEEVIGIVDKKGIEKATREELDLVTFLDLDWKAVNKQLEREKARRRSGPVAEALLRDVGVVGARNY